LKTPLLAAPVCLAAFLAVPPVAGAQVMPDPKEIAGVPLPVSDVPAGTVTVRVIKGSLANNIAGQMVELSVDGGRGAARQAKTAESGRAEFAGLPPGARVKASTVVAGERLESQEFPVPASGGIRLLLVATDPESATRESEDRRPAAGPAQPGTIVLGEQSRFVFELGDQAVNVFNILQIVNTTGAPVEPAQPLVFQAAPNGGTVSLLNGSTPRAKADGRSVHVAGPFPPGPTLVQFAYAVRYSGANLTIEQRMPAALNQVTLLAQKVGAMEVTSPQVAERREMTAQGDTYIVGQGRGVNAGDRPSAVAPPVPSTGTSLAPATAPVEAATGRASASRRPGEGRSRSPPRHRDRPSGSLWVIRQPGDSGARPADRTRR